MTTPQEQRLQSFLSDAFPAAPAPDALKARVAALAAQRERRDSRDSSRARRLRLGFAGAAFCAAVAAIVSIQPQWSAAQALRRMDAAMAGARSCQSTFWISRPDGTPYDKGRTWSQDGKWRNESLLRTPEIEIYANGRVWRYHRSENIVRVRKADGPAEHNASGFTIQSMTHDYALMGLHETIRLGSKSTVAGRPVHTVFLETDRADQPERQEFLVDTATDLPVSECLYVKQNEKWILCGAGTMVYNQTLPASLFTPVFPTGTRVLDVDQSREELRRRLAKGIETKTVADRKIVIRDLQVNKNGDVFLLYSAGKHPGDLFQCHNRYAGRDWKIALTDDRGVRYLPQGYLGPLDDPNAEHREMFVYDAERLEGDWWIPETPQAPWKPRRFTLTFHVNSVNLHGGENSPKKTADYAATTSFTLAAARPEVQGLPEYFTDLSLNDISVDSAESQARLRNAWDRAYTEADDAEHRAHDYPRALAKYQQAIVLQAQLERSEGRSYGTNSWMWLGVYRVQSAMHHRPEALAALRHAEEEALRGAEAMNSDPAKDYQVKRVRALMKQEGIA
ncbi:hypothetical protein CCAX7_18000 [Capsulimonas corticalis]|uniref:Uncharacterized protein n=1 Tax=Capsulimonas corticalis TaxID=2219043 RepID=A0A402D725_9BACT|nr:hypothetical protein [Capsulimonas corticalis]BDI29749.1 hypothetical protein CCAX7_18000 [Capsulimonas corticalis]